MTEFLLTYYDTPVAGIIIFSLLLIYGISRASVIVKKLNGKQYRWQDNFGSDFFIIVAAWPNTWMPLAKFFEVSSGYAGMSIFFLSLLAVIFLIFAPLRIYLSLQRHFTAQLN